MLHILWMIIKFILLILGILLGLLFLVVMLILFCPVCYQVQAEKTRETPLKEAAVCARISWLFRGIFLKIKLDKGKPDFTVRILGIPINGVRGYVENRKRRESQSGGISRNDTVRPENTREDLQETEGIIETEHVSGAMNDSSGSREVHRAESAESKDYGLFLRIMGKIKDVTASAVETVKKIISFPAAFSDKIRKFTLTIRTFCGKIDWWKKFLSHPKTKETLSLVWTDIKKLIRHILPTKMTGQVTFGSEDPSITGTVLAALGISFPLHKNCVAVAPVFEGKNVLGGNIRLQGRIYGCVFLKTAIEIYFNKNVKYVIRRWKHKEG